MLVDRIRKELSTEQVILPLEGPHDLQNFRKSLQNRFFIIFACCLSISLCDSDVYLRFTVVYLGSEILYETGKGFFT